MKFEYPYQVSKEEARERLGVLGEYLSNRHGLKANWDGDAGTFTGKYLMVKIEGSLTILDGVVKFQGRDPGMLWRKKAMDYLKGKLQAYLDPNTPVENLQRTK